MNAKFNLKYQTSLPQKHFSHIPTPKFITNFKSVKKFKQSNQIVLN